MGGTGRWGKGSEKEKGRKEIMKGGASEGECVSPTLDTRSKSNIHVNHIKLAADLSIVDGDPQECKLSKGLPYSVWLPEMILQLS